MKLIALALSCILPFAVGCGDNLDALPDGQPVVPDTAVVLVDAPVSVPDASVAIDAPPNPDGPVDGGFSLACTVADLTPIFTCAQTSCTADPSLTCVLTHCGLLVLGLPPACQQCVLAGVGGDLTTTIAACLGLP